MFKTTNMLIWFSNGRYIQDDYGQIILEEKPTFSFAYESIKYYWNEKVYSVDESGEEINLTQSQHDEIEQFIKLKRESVGVLGFCVDKDGKFLGRKRVDDSDVYETVTVSPPTGDDWIFDFSDEKWKRVYYYTERGTYTHSTDSNAIGFTYEQKPIDGLEYKLDSETNSWVIDETSETISAYKKKCLDDLIKHYVDFLLVQNVEHKDIINKLSGIQEETFANDMIRNSVEEITSSNTISSITETYEISKQISLSIKK